MPGGSKQGGGLEIGSAYKMKNSALRKSVKYGTPMQANYSPMKHEPVPEHKHPHTASIIGAAAGTGGGIGGAIGAAGGSKKIKK